MSRGLDIYEHKVLNLCPKKLYHTTIRHTKQSELYWKERIEEGTPAPPLGEYHTDLVPPKFFTAHPLADYSSPWMPEAADEIFLEYTLKQDVPMRLWDLRDLRMIPWYPRIKMLREVGFDGYIGREDYIEIYLDNPSKWIRPEDCREIPFDTKTDRNIARINGETMDLLLRD